MAYETILVEQKGAVTLITINRPQALNALNSQVLTDLIDAFAAFEESDFAADTGYRFRDSVLANGGSRPARELFREFRGRDPQIDALLRHNGLLAEAA